LLGYPEYPGDAAHPDALTIEGTEGTPFVGPDGQAQVKRRDSTTDVYTVDTRDAYQRSRTVALAHCARCLGSGTLFETSGDDCLVGMGLVFTVRRSAATRPTVVVAPITVRAVAWSVW